MFRGIAVSGFRSFFPAYMGRLGYSLGEVGVVATLASLAGAAASPAVGYLLEVRSSRAVTAFTGLVIATSLTILPFTRGMAGLTLSYTLFSLAFYFAQPARTVFLVRTVSTERLGTVVGVTTLAFTVSRTVGPVVGGYLIGVYGYSTTFLILALVATAGSLAFLSLSWEPETAREGQALSLLDAYRRAFRPSRDLAVTYLFASLDRAAWNLWSPMLSAYLLQRGYDEVAIGTLISVSNVAEALITPVAGRLTDRLGSSVALAVSEATAAVAALSLVSPVPHYVAALTMVLMGASIGFWIPGYSVYVAKVFRGSIGEAFASINAVRSLVSVPAPYLGGLLYEVLAPAAPFVLSSAMLVATTGVASTSLRAVEGRARPSS